MFLLNELNEYQKLDLMRKRCDGMLLSMLGVEATAHWWNSKNAAFNNKTPEESWSNDPDSVYRHIVGHVDGYW
jgi:hypothetical protein